MAENDQGLNQAAETGEGIAAEVRPPPTFNHPMPNPYWFHPHPIPMAENNQGQNPAAEAGEGIAAGDRPPSAFHRPMPNPYWFQPHPMFRYPMGPEYFPRMYPFPPPLSLPAFPPNWPAYPRPWSNPYPRPPPPPPPHRSATPSASESSSLKEEEEDDFVLPSSDDDLVISDLEEVDEPKKKRVRTVAKERRPGHAALDVDKFIEEVRQGMPLNIGQQVELGVRKKSKFTSEQRLILESLFKRCSYPSKLIRDTLAVKIGLEPLQVFHWFQNRRSKQKMEEHGQKRENRRGKAVIERMMQSGTFPKQLENNNWSWNGDPNPIINQYFGNNPQDAAKL